ncbi:MAG: hypothetical protein ACXVDE_00465 [Tumebacillaceae bacterium]
MSFKQHIQTERYAISVPREWHVVQGIGGSLTFQKANHSATHQWLGGVDVLGFYPGQSISNLVPNGAEITSLNQVEGVPNAFEVKVRIYPPAASNDQTVVEQTHFYYLIPEQRTAYDLYFQSHEVHEHTAVEVAQSFVVKQ